MTSNEYPPTSAQVTPPSPIDGPDEPVDWRELEEEGHPTLPGDANDDEAEDEL